jgi:hypothetical protein
MEIKETMSLQEIATSPIATGSDSPAHVIQAQLDRGFFDPYEADVLEAWRVLGKETREKFMNTVRTIPLPTLLKATNPKTWNTVPNSIKEFLASSGTAGIAGAYYLIPVKLWDEMATEAADVDIVAGISKVMLGPEDIAGTTMKVDIAKDGQYIVNVSSSGAIAPTETIETVQATLNFSDIYTINFRLANDLIEDAQFDLVDLHVREAGRQIGDDASNRAITIMGTAPDGDGTINTCTSTTNDVTKWYDATAVNDDILDAIGLNAADGFSSDLLITTKHAMLNSIIETAGVGAGNETTCYNDFMHNGWPTKLGPLNVFYNDGAYLSVAAAYTNALSVVGTKNYSIMSGRKRWMRLEKYSEPVRDLQGAVVSYRQDSVSLFKDSITLYTEV